MPFVSHLLLQVFTLIFFHGKHSFICVFSISRMVSYEGQGFGSLYTSQFEICNCVFNLLMFAELAMRL